MILDPIETNPSPKYIQNPLYDNSLSNPFLGPNDKGSDSIVVQLGSHSIKFGLASQEKPFVIPNVIAHLITNPPSQNDEMIIDQINNNDIDKVSEEFKYNLQNIEKEILMKESKAKTAKKLAILNANKSQPNQKYQNAISEIPERLVDQPPGSTGNYKKMEAMFYDLNDDIINNNFKWTYINDKPKMLIGREAQCIPDTCKEYEIRYPIKFGYFNNDYSVYAVLQDLEFILDFCFNEVLQIPKEAYTNYNIVLIIPDVFIRVQVKMLVNLFLRTMNFKQIFLHLESVMSAFGMALQSACVVDVGSDKINICCVEEGVILEETLIRKNFGGRDMTTFLYLYMKQSAIAEQKNGSRSFPYELFDINNNNIHFRIFEKIKENDCEFPDVQSASLGMAQFVPKYSKLWLHKKNTKTKQINFTLVEPAYITPLCLFFPDIIYSFKTDLQIPIITHYNDINGDIFPDPEDSIAEQIKIFANVEKKEESMNMLNSLTSSGKKINIMNNNSDNNDEDSLSQAPSKTDDVPNSVSDERDYLHNRNTYGSMFDLREGLDSLICQSLMNIQSQELRKKLTNAIILVGGCAKIKGFVDYLEDRLINQLPLLDNEIERVMIINPQDKDMKTLTWIGGSVLPKLESAKDMWIQRERWLGLIEKPEEGKDKEMNNNNKEDDGKEKDKEGKDNEKDVKEELNSVKKEGNDVQNGNGTVNKEITEGNKPEGLKEKKRRVERHIDGGIKLIREKCPFSW